LEVEFFPEGGDLVAGVPNRVYFQVRTPAGKPAELKGRVVDSRDTLVARVETLHDDKNPGANQGCGVFVLPNPAAGGKYELKIDSPTGIKGRHQLPDVAPDGVVLSIPGVVTDNIPVTLHNSKTGRKLLVGAYCRGRLLDHTTVAVGSLEKTRVDLKPQLGVGGVYRVTVFEMTKGGDLKPLAERLIFRRPAERVDLTIQSDKKVYTPGERVKLSLKATDEKKRPAAAILMMAVVDKSVITLADDKTARSLPTQFFLMTEVRGPEDLEHADFLLTDNSLAERALDLLLGTQGWRRFAEQQDPWEFRGRQKKDAERLLVVSGRQPLLKGLAAQPEAAGDDGFSPKIAKLQGKIEGEDNRNVRVLHSLTQKRYLKGTAVSNARVQAEVTRATADQYARSARNAWLFTLGVLLGCAGVGGLVIGLVRIAQSQGSGVPVAWYATGLGSLVLGGVVVAWLVHLREHDPRDRRQDMAMRAAEGKNQGGAPEKLMKPGGGGMAFPGGADRNAADGDDEGAAQKKPMVPPPAAMPENDRGPLRRGPMPRFGTGAKGVAPAPGMPLKGKAGKLRDEHDADRLVDKTKVGPAVPPPPRMMLAKIPEGMTPVRPFVVREYAHRHQTHPKNVRTDFAETLYWHPVLVLPDGRKEVSFDLCDSVTTFQVLAFAHTLDGRLGAVKAEIRSRLPFTLQPAAPLEVTANDTITVPLAVRNATDRERTVKVRVEAKGLKLLDPKTRVFKVGAEDGARPLFRFRATIVEGEARLLFQGECGPFQDRIEIPIRVVPDGFPVVKAESGLLEKVARHKVTLPGDCLRDTLKFQVQVYPSTLADLQKGLEGLLREPYGCFEQTSTSNYPNVLILDYLQQSNQTNPEAVRRARQLLDNGYKKLTQFECQPPGQTRRGYEWFGGAAPPHEALTAYGLLQFRDMARVFPVDKAMLQRTRQFLMDQKDGKGGFRRNPKAIDGFGAAPVHITNAYIVWALTEGGKDDDVTKELANLSRKAKDSTDPYFLALVANSLLNRGQTGQAEALLLKLAKAQEKDGHLNGKETSITRSGGKDLQIEATALTVLAWLKVNAPKFTLNLNLAIKWISAQRGGYGGFGSTQSTILALKALIAYTQAHKKTAEAGTLTLFVNGKEVGSRRFPAGAQEPITVALPQPDEVLKPGVENQVRVAISGKNNFPYTLSWSYRVKTPGSVKNCPVELTTRLDRTEVKEADKVRLTVEVANRTGKGQGMAVAIIGLPAGLKVPEDLKQLEGYVRLRDKAPRADGRNLYLSAYEIRGRELVLYWRDLGPDEKIRVNLDLVGWVPGEYRGPASRAYLYYNADKKCWREPLRVTVAPR
jgi:hypothetical protein